MMVSGLMVILLIGSGLMVTLLMTSWERR